MYGTVSIQVELTFARLYYVLYLTVVIRTSWMEFQYGSENLFVL